MDSYLEALDRKRMEAANRMKEIVSTAEAEGRALTAEEQENLRQFDADYDRYEAERRDLANYKDKVDAADRFRAAIAPTMERPREERRDPSDMEMFREMLRRGGEYDSMPSDRILRTRDWNPDITLRALQSEGGSAVPTSFADFVTVYERTFTPMLNPAVVTVLNRVDGSPLVLPRVTADPAHGGTITAEAGGVNELDATISNVQLNPYKYAITNLWSAELAQDNTIGLEDIIARTTGRELGIDIGAHLTTGDGSTKPQGFAVAGQFGGSVTASGTANNTFVGPEDVVDAFYTLAAPYRTVATWQASTTGVAKIRKLKDSTGQFIWQPGLATQPDTVLGRPIYENPGLAAVASASLSIFVGDFSRYVVARVVPIRVESSIHYKFNTDQIALRTIERVDGHPIDTAAFVALKSANA